MSHVGWLAQKSFNKIFNNLAKELNEDVSNIQIGIYYKNNCHIYEAYKNFVKEKDIDLDNYCGAIMDLSGGTAAIDATIAQAGPKYAKELSEKLKREIKTDDVNIIMKYNDGELPFAVLMTGKEKHRKINIAEEFLNT